MSARLPADVARPLRPVERTVLRANERMPNRARMLRAKEDLALQALFAWYRGEATDADLREAAGDLVRALERQR